MSAQTPLRIGILGSGNMGRALGVRYAQLGHPVHFGGRSASTTQQRAAELAKSHAPSAASITSGTLDETAQASDVLVWTLRDRDPTTVLSQAGIAALDGKLIMDLNNRDFAKDVAAPEGIRQFDRSLGEQLQGNLPQAHVVKAFNTVAMEALDTSIEKVKAGGGQIWVAGMGPSKVRAVVVGLVEELGFEVVDLGDGPTPMRIAEALGDAVRWVMISGKRGGRTNLGVRMLPSPDLGMVGDREASNYQ